jgi:DNA-binding IclR family transcriptional regulator
VTSFERGLKILDLLVDLEGDLARRARGLSIQQAADELGVHKSTASRLMQTLVATRYAVPNRDSARGFRLGPAAQTDRDLTIDQCRLRDLAQPVLGHLVEQTGECAHAAVAAGRWALVVGDAQTSQPLRVVTGTGRRMPLHATSAGKCLLAYGLATIPDELSSRTPRTVTSLSILRLHLAEILERGWAFDDEESYPGVRCISAPVFNAEGEPIGCIGIDGPSFRVTDERVDAFTRDVRDAAERLSALVGDGEPDAAC